jgi:hypothetical protein
VLVAVAFDPGSGGGTFALPLTIAGLGLGGAVVLQDLVQSSAPTEQASDVAGLSRSSSYLGQSIGVALAGAVLVGVLLTSTSSGVQTSPVLTAEQQQTVKARIDAGVAISAASDEQVRTTLQDQGAAPQVVDEAVRVNSQARDAGLTAAMIMLAISAALGALMSLRLPRDPTSAARRTTARA